MCAGMEIVLLFDSLFAKGVGWANTILSDPILTDSSPFAHPTHRFIVVEQLITIWSGGEKW
ncbi:hypothetical protein BJP34_27625 [Moorena producens PAL-8-15-08-1]|uniref:Uncharacterized protein n=1 Tax=Moorena producens PAL-8-15-08-1 TaxID=1458985 RepID=A0A1D8TYH2_9CYAN|nr:hypothetical protein BJP34_27625 [Moorena producens PAL-8-15-08-1]